MITHENISRKIIRKEIFFVLLLGFVFNLMSLDLIGKNVEKENIATNQSRLETLLKTPDFAMPSDLARNADEALVLASANSDYQGVLRSLILLIISKESISEDNTAALYELLSEEIDKLPMPYKQVGYLLKAQFLMDIYDSYRFRYDSRSLPVEKISEDPRDWSGEQFRLQIELLADSVLGEKKELNKYPLNEISGLVKINTGDLSERDSLSDFSVYDFCVYRIGDIFQRVGLENRIKPLIESISYNEEGVLLPVRDERSLLARLMLIQSASESERKILIERSCEESASGEMYPLLLIGIYNNFYHNFTEKEQQRFYSLLTSVVRRDDIQYAQKIRKSLQTIIYNIAQESIELNCNSQFLPDKGIEIEWRSNSLREFNVLTVKLPDNIFELIKSNNKKSVSLIKKYGKLVGATSVSYSDSIPFRAAGTLQLSGQSIGNYVIIASKNKTLSGIKGGVGDYLPIKVSDLSYFIVDEGEKKQLVVVNATTGAPVDGAFVKIIERKNLYSQDRGKIWERHSDSLGIVELPTESSALQIIITKGEDQIDNSVWNYRNQESYRESQPHIGLFTDLGIYKPGNEMHFTGILYQCENNIPKVESGKDVIFTLRSPNHQEVDRITLGTDNYGRATGSFTIPQRGMTGTYHIQAEYGGRSIGSVSFQVAEYKSPTFRVILNSPRLDRDGKIAKIIFDGHVSTYSGIVLRDVETELNLVFEPYWRWWNPTAGNERLSLNFKATTDNDGKFIIEIPIDLLKTNESTGILKGVASAVSETGERIDSEEVRFQLGNIVNIFADIPEQKEITMTSENLEINVLVRNGVGEIIERELKYEFKGVYASDAVVRGDFKSPNLSIPVDKLPSGTYEYSITLADDPETKELSDSVSGKIVIWREGDKRSPSENIIWIPRRNIYAVPGSKTTTIRLGTSLASPHIYMLKCKSGDLPVGEWIDVRSGMNEVEVESPTDGERIVIKFFGLWNLKNENLSLTIYSAADQVKLNIKTDTFRDKLTPGDTERWSFTLNMDGRTIGELPALAVMSNSALDAIAPFDWRFNPRGDRLWKFTGGINPAHINKEFFSFIWSKPIGNIYYRLPHSPDWNFYGHSLYGYGGRIMMKNMSLAMSRNSTMEYSSADIDDQMTYNEVKADAMEEESAIITGSSADEGNEVDPENYREIECPLAFFRPMLVSTESGNIELEFTVPNFNTEWKLQLLSYTPEGMYVAKNDLTSVAAKKIMVSTNPPRFLRTDDKAIVEASIYNASETEQLAKGIMEVFNTISGDILSEHIVNNIHVEPGGSKTIRIEFRVPEGLNTIGVRCRAISQCGSDGEQVAIPVLPSSIPVLDSSLFYLTPDTEEYVMRIPKMKKGSNVTLQYCDDPQWEVLMSLSGCLETDKRSAIGIADAIYTTLAGRNILLRNKNLASQLERAVEEEDSVILSSPLQRNSGLKMASLDETPWVNNAYAETARMRSIVHLTQKENTDAMINELNRKLTELQGINGGWTWIKGFSQSRYITECILERFMGLKLIGALQNSYDETISKGIAFVDAEISDSYSTALKQDKNYSPGLMYLDYLFVRDYLCGQSGKSGGKIEEIRRKTIAELSKEWKHLDVSDKCVGAIFAKENGNDHLAETIMASVSQFASYSPDKGMWFEAATGPFARVAPERCVALATIAYSMVSPGSEEIEKLIQFLLLSRQNQDWNSVMTNSQATFVASAVLACYGRNDKVTEDREMRIFIDGKELTLNENAGIHGSFTMNLSPQKLSGKELKIVRQKGNPAWGAVMSQYVESLGEVRSVCSQYLTIDRAYYPLLSDSLRGGVGRSTTKFRKGEKVLVTLTITADRPLDYLMVMDERSASTEPSDQLVRYQSQEGLVYIIEPRNSSTNIYFEHVPKGRWIINYEAYMDRDGEYAVAPASVQSLYYPYLNARTGADIIIVK